MMEKGQVRFSQRVLSTLLSVLLATQPLLPAVAATIAPTGNTQVDKAANGVPVVNIATPNQSGISHNKYTDYNVGKEGLILKNATGKLNQTQLGGLIQNNPNLKAGQEAKGIINEVTGTSRSSLQGYTEVAGKAANVMVANPYGITCNGCGFINTPNATLTTGKPVFDASGNLQALDVKKGSITIEGQGLDASSTDALSIISRATEVNAALHAKDLKVVAGANRVGTDGSVQAQQGEGSAPVVAVDTGALGGMYANRIHLVSSEKGVGVNLGDLNARQGDITLDAGGKLTVNNSLASGALIAKGERVSLTGDHKAGGNLSITGQENVELNQATLLTDKNLQLNAGGNLVLNGTTLTSGQDMAVSGKHIEQDRTAQANAAGTITLTGEQSAALKGQLAAGKQLNIAAGSLENTGQWTAGEAATVKAQRFDNRGAVQGKILNIAANILNSTGSLNSGSSLTINADTLTLQGDTGAKGHATLTASGTLDNRGNVVSDDMLTINASQMTNSGMLSGAKGVNATASSVVTASKSVIHSDGNLTLNGQETTLAGEISAGGAVTVTGRTLTTAATSQLQGRDVKIAVQNAQLAGTQTASDTMDLSAREGLTHAGKTSAATLTANGAQLNNSGVMTADALRLEAPHIINSGLLKGGKTLSLVATLLTNKQPGMIYSPSALALSVQDLNNAGVITSDATLSLTGTQLTNSGELSGSTLALNAGTLNNSSSGLLLAQGDSHITAKTLTNAGAVAGQRLTLNADRLDSSGLLQGESALTLTAGMLNLLSGSRALTSGELRLSATQLNTAGQIQGKTVNLAAQNWQQDGRLLATDTLFATAEDALNNTGDIMSQGNLQMSASSLDNRGRLLSESDTSLSGALINNRGVVQGNTLTAHADTIANSGTLTGLAALTLASRLEMAAPLLTLTNSNTGALLTAGTLTVTSAATTNAGQWQGKRILISADTLTNSGAIQAEDTLTATLTGNLSGTSGNKITANGDMALSALGMNNTGQWIAKNLTLNSASLANNGEITGVEGLGLTLTQRLDNQASGRLLSAGGLALDSGEINNAGQIQGGATRLSGKTLSNSGRVQGESLYLNTSGELNNAVGGVLLSQNTLGVTSPTLVNAGTIQGGGDASLSAATRIQNDGSLLSGGKLTLTAPELANGGVVQAVSLLLNVVKAANGGRILATGSAELQGTTLNNTGTLQGAALLVNYQNLTNSGTVLGTSSLTVKGDAVTNTAGGKLFSAGSLALNSSSLTSAGQIVALGDATLQLLSALDIRGTVASSKTLSLTSQAGITNNGTVQGNSLVLNAGGALTNNGQLTAGDGNSAFSAQNILLNAAGSVSAGGDVVMTSLSDITINGFTGTAGSLTMNAAGMLLNPALIYAANNMQLFADRIHNIYGDILAGDSLWMQKNAAGAVNVEIINRSGTIETTRGDITLRTSNLLNEADGLTVSQYEREQPDSIPDAGDYLLPSDKNGRPSDFTLSLGEWFDTPDDIIWSYWGETCAGNSQVCRERYSYLLLGNDIRRYVLSESAVEASAKGGAARIASARDITINAGVLDNRGSQILAGRNATLTGGTLNNLSAESGRSVTYIEAEYRCEWFSTLCDTVPNTYQGSREYGVWYSAGLGINKSRLETISIPYILVNVRQSLSLPVAHSAQ